MPSKFETSIQDVSAEKIAEMAKQQYHPELKHDECQKGFKRDSCYGDFKCKIKLQRIHVDVQMWLQLLPRPWISSAKSWMQW